MLFLRGRGSIHGRLVGRLVGRLFFRTPLFCSWLQMSSRLQTRPSPSRYEIRQSWPWECRCILHGSYTTDLFKLTKRIAVFHLRPICSNLGNLNRRCHEVVKPCLLDYIPDLSLRITGCPKRFVC